MSEASGDNQETHGELWENRWESWKRKLRSCGVVGGLRFLNKLKGKKEEKNMSRERKIHTMYPDRLKNCIISGRSNPLQFEATR